MLGNVKLPEACHPLGRDGQWAWRACQETRVMLCFSHTLWASLPSHKTVGGDTIQHPLWFSNSCVLLLIFFLFLFYLLFIYIYFSFSFLTYCFSMVSENWSFITIIHSAFSFLLPQICSDLSQVCFRHIPCDFWLHFNFSFSFLQLFPLCRIPFLFCSLY